VRTVAVIGTGLVGTSVALALRQDSAEVFLVDIDPVAVRIAAERGAGTAVSIDQLADVTVDICVVATPPSTVASVLAAGQRLGIARAFTDVASVKVKVHDDIHRADIDTARFIGGHPLAGRERGGPGAARADLFVGRRWVLTPTAETAPTVIDAVEEMVMACGAKPITMTPIEHDQAVATTSHLPHIMASLTASQLLGFDERAAALCGQGIRDVTRVAASDADLWSDILVNNAEPLIQVLRTVSKEMDGLIAALESIDSTLPHDAHARARHRVGDLLRRAALGRSGIPGKHGEVGEEYAEVAVVVSDTPGELARLFAEVGQMGVNVEDVLLEHLPGRRTGLARLLVARQAAETMRIALEERRFVIDI
jgi:prephenate dehydrogenase